MSWMDYRLAATRGVEDLLFSETCVIRSANPNAPDPDEPYTDSQPMPCSYVPASTTEVLTAGGVTLATRAHVELPAAQFGRVHADDRIQLIDSTDPVLAAHIANQRLVRRPMQFAVVGEPDVPSTRLIANVRSV